ncbi:hypothetical protein BZG13_02070 [Salinivibrio sp. ML323]|nr:hypothetical protein BZG13_02070 [Salinivibrio sp. ML323]
MLSFDFRLLCETAYPRRVALCLAVLREQLVNQFQNQPVQKLAAWINKYNMCANFYQSFKIKGLNDFFILTAKANSKNSAVFLCLAARYGNASPSFLPSI